MSFSSELKEELSKLNTLANKEVDQEKVNKYLKELEEVELIKVDKQNIFVYDVLS